MKFFFDNNLSPHLARAVGAASYRDNVEVVPLRDKFSPSISDSEWLGNLSKEGGWTIVSGDRRVRTRPEERAAWRQAGLTTFFLSQKTWHTNTYWEIVWHFFRWWPVIVDQADRVQAGAAYEVPYGYSKGRLKQLPL